MNDRSAKTNNPFANPSPLLSGILIEWMYRKWQAENRGPSEREVAPVGLKAGSR